MKRTLTAAAAAVIALTSFSGAALAQPGQDRHGSPGYEHSDNRVPGARGEDNPGQDNRRQDFSGHDNSANANRAHDDRGRHNWRKGQRVGHDEWRRYKPVDYRRHHLRRPPRGYEWREVNGDYVLGAATTGLILSIIAATR